MHARSSRLALLATLPLLGLGCGAVEGQEDAGRGMQTIMGLLGSGVPAGLQAAVDDGRPTSFRGGRRQELDHMLIDPAFGLDGGLALSVNVDCPSGGKMKIDGRTSLMSELGGLEGWDPYASLALEFDLDVKFRRCKVDGVKLGGDLHYALDVDVDSTAGEASLEWSYTGDVTFRGDIEGRCEIDMVASARSGDAFTDLEVRAYAGTMCGLDAEEVSAYAALDASS